MRPRDAKRGHKEPESQLNQPKTWTARSKPSGPISARYSLAEVAVHFEAASLLSGREVGEIIQRDLDTAF
jgi:hypothetical protein